MDIGQELQRKFVTLFPCLDERQRRLLAAAEARSLGYGGISRVSRACGLSRVTIQGALEELDSPMPHPGRVRRPGGGRKKLRAPSPQLLKALEDLVAPETRGDPMSPLLWTCKSTRQLAEALEKRGLTAGYHVVGRMLHDLGYSLQAPAKTLEGKERQPGL